jgi:hypothetical protein
MILQIIIRHRQPGINRRMRLALLRRQILAHEAFRHLRPACRRERHGGWKDHRGKPLELLRQDRNAAARCSFPPRFRLAARFFGRTVDVLTRSGSCPVKIIPKEPGNSEVYGPLYMAPYLPNDEVTHQVGNATITLKLSEDFGFLYCENFIHTG